MATIPSTHSPPCYNFAHRDHDSGTLCPNTRSKASGVLSISLLSAVLSKQNANAQEANPSNKFTPTIQSTLINLKTFSLQPLPCTFSADRYTLTDLGHTLVADSVCSGLCSGPRTQLFTHRSAAPSTTPTSTSTDTSTNASPQACLLDSDRRLVPPDSTEPQTLPEARGDLARRLQTRVFGRGDLVFRAHLSKERRKKKKIGEETPLKVGERVKSNTRWALPSRRTGCYWFLGGLSSRNETGERPSTGRSQYQATRKAKDIGTGAPQESPEEGTQRPDPQLGAPEAVSARHRNHLEQLTSLTLIQRAGTRESATWGSLYPASQP